MKRTLLSIFTILLFLTGCEQKTEKTEATATCVETHVLHKDSVSKLTPEYVVEILKSGNANFVTKKTQQRDAVAQLTEAANDGQSPMAIVLSCMDSRVPVETIFDKGVGDIFVIRVAGNIVNEDMVGSMEYACAHAGAKVVVVLGHENCGAVHAACQGVQEGNMTQMLAKLQPAIDSCATGKADVDKHSKEFQDQVITKNVYNMVSNVRQGSTMIKEMEDKGDVKIIGAVFNLHTGVVEFL